MLLLHGFDQTAAPRTATVSDSSSYSVLSASTYSAHLCRAPQVFRADHGRVRGGARNAILICCAGVSTLSFSFSFFVSLHAMERKGEGQGRTRSGAGRCEMRRLAFPDGRRQEWC